MTNYLTQVINVVIVFFLTLLLNFGIEYFTSDNGAIRVGELISIDTKEYKPIDIENYDGSLINDIKISIPKDTNVKNIVSSKPVLISLESKILASSVQNIMIVSSVSGPGVTRLLIPVDSKTSDCCNIVNPKDIKVSIKDDSSVINPIKRAFYKGVQTAIIYSIFILILAIWITSRMKELENNLNKITEEMSENKESSNKKADDIKRDLLEIRKIYKRQRIFLLRRISDYSKEVEFWRNTLRKILLANVSDKKTIENMLREISKSIDTFSTHGNTVKEYENFEVLQEVILELNEGK